MDKKYASSKQSFKQVRGNAKPPLTEIKEVIQDFVKVIPLDDQIYGQFTHGLSCQFPVMPGDFSARVLSVEDDAAIVDLGDAIWPGDEDTHITQRTFSCDPTEMANQLNAFLLPIWRNDPLMDDLEQGFPDLQSITQHFPVHPAISIDMMNPDLWIAAIKKQKAGSARGIAVSSQEFKLLPRGFVATLAHVMAQYPTKTDDLPDGSSARPITILSQSQLYGTWAAVATSQIVKVLAHWVPLGLLDFCLQFELDLAAKVRNRCSGIVVDLKKCFNNIRWICGFISLKEIGVPTEILRVSIRLPTSVDIGWFKANTFMQRPLLGWLMERGGSGSISYCVGLLSCQHHPRSLTSHA